MKIIIVFFVASFFLVGCDERDADTPNSDLSGLATVLSASFVSRDPTNSSPTQLQQQILMQRDQLLFSGGTSYSFYDSFIQDLRSKAGIDPRAGIFVTSDLRTSFSFGGGIAGHDILILDGKFLDILREYSFYIALFDSGVVSESQVFALNTIVRNHNSLVAQNNSNGFVYLSSSLQSSEMVVADSAFKSMLAAILYHEFGHLYLYHAFDHAKLSGMNPTLAQYVKALPNDENYADHVSGMLVRKSTLNLGFAKEMFDIMAFYTFQRNDQLLSYAVVLSSEFQKSQFRTNYSSQLRRKQLMDQGYQAMATVLSQNK